jgi:hypothetical protein
MKCDLGGTEKEAILGFNSKGLKTTMKKPPES